MATNAIQILITAKDQASKAFSQVGDEIDNMSSSSAKNVAKASDQMESSLGGLSTKSAVLLGAVAGAAQAVVSKGINLITNSIGDAVSRVDTLNNASRTFANMGFTTQNVDKAMTALKGSILGLPTSLNSAVSNVQILAASVNDVGKGQKVFSALNDAILGFGGDSAMVKNATIQLSQAFSNGKVDGMTWISMMNSGMGPVLNAMARQMGITTGALKDGLADGSISVEQFQQSLQTLDTEGGGGLKSLHQIAKDSTKGIGTGMENAKTAMVRGLADIISAIGAANISGLIAKAGAIVEQTFKKVAAAIKETTSFIKDNQAWLKPVAVMIGAIAAVWLVWAGAIKAWTIATNIAKTAQMAYNAVLAANPIMLIIMAIAALVAGFIYLWNTSDGFKNFFLNMWSTIKKVFDTVVTFIKDHWQLMVAVLTGGIGILVMLIVRNWDTIRSAAETAFNAVKAVVLAVWGFIWNFIIKPYITLIKIEFEVLRAVFTYVFEWMRALAMLAWNFIWNNVISPIIGFITGAINGLVLVVTTVWNAISTGASIAWNWIWNNVISPVINAIVGAANWVGGIFAGVWNWISSMASGAFNGIANVASAVWGRIVGVWNGVFGFFSGIAGHIGGALSGAFNGLAGAAEGAFNGVKNAVKGGINWVIDKINWMIGKVNSVADKVPGAPHLPNIPQLATGTNFFQGGVALVGEHGPELVNLPRGSSVKNASATTRVADSGGLGGGTTNQITLQVIYNGRGQFSPDDAVDMGKQIIRALRSQGLNLDEMAQLR